MESRRRPLTARGMSGHARLPGFTGWRAALRALAAGLNRLRPCHIVPCGLDGRWTCGLASRRLDAKDGRGLASDLELKGRNALVTGASKGIGRAIADLFAAEGANVAICARNAGEVEDATAALAARGVKAWGEALDVGDADALKHWVDGAARELGGVDALVCNVSALAVGDSPRPGRNPSAST